MKRTSKKEVEAEIKKFFENLSNKSPEEIKKIKKLSMRHNLKLGKLRKSFCRKCLYPYFGKEKIKIRSRIKSIQCKKCGYVSRWKIKLS